jgi:hypothetical protein
MIYTLTFSELAASVFSALLLVSSLYAMGRLVLSRLKWKDTGADAAVVTGMAFNHLVFILLSLCFEGETTVMLMHTLHIVSLATAMIRQPKWFKPHRKISLRPAIILVVLYLPYLFSPVSPPMNYDAMFAYVHNAEWVYHHGLAFNPSSTAYITMPMGAEYLFAQAFPIGGKLSIFLFDAFFGMLLVRRAYHIAARHFSASASLLLVLCLLLVPEGIPFLFGIAKIDTINIYLIVTGFGWLLEKNHPFSLWFALLAFSMACAVKYTGWLQLSFPIAIIVMMIGRMKGVSKGVFAAMIPLLFFGPVLMKNMVQTGNMLVGLRWSPSQQVYVERHTGITKAELSKKITGNIEQKKDPVKTTIQLSYFYLNFVLYGFLALMLLAALAIGVNVSDLWWSVLFLIAALGPWHLFVGASLQPPRFLVAFYFVIILLCFMIGSRMMKHVGMSTSNFLRYGFMVAFSITFFNTYYRHGNRIPRFMQSQQVPLHQWYEQTGNYVFSITTRLRDEGWLCQRIMYMSPIAKGLLTTDQLTLDHADSARWNYRNQFSAMRNRYDYVLCNERDILKYGLKEKPVMMQSGHMFLIKLN